ncbi:MAG: hypothetical protein ACLRM8_02220 [Alistipes sp.]
MMDSSLEDIIGGDESPRAVAGCPECQSASWGGVKTDTRHSAEDKLQGYFNTDRGVPRT